MKILYDYFTNIAEKSSQISTKNASIKSSESSSYILRVVANSFELKRLCFSKNIRVEYEKLRNVLFIRFAFGTNVVEENELIDKKINSLLNELFQPIN